MRCPLCDVSMREVERRGVRIDVCSECRGVWLDRGELEKLMAVEAGGDRDDREERGRPDPERSRRDDDDFRDSDRGGDRAPYDSDRGHGYGYKKKKNWLSDIFEFGD